MHSTRKTVKTLKTSLVVPVLGLAVAVLALAALAAIGPAANAAPPAAPTAVANLVASDSGNYFEFASNQAYTADTQTEKTSLAGFEWADIQYYIDQAGSDVNTTTVTIQYSNDGEHWVNGPAIASANVADGGDITRYPLFGRYTRFDVNVSTTDTIRLWVNLLAK